VVAEEEGEESGFAGTVMTCEKREEARKERNGRGWLGR
jgi:hypothetical protein